MREETEMSKFELLFRKFAILTWALFIASMSSVAEGSIFEDERTLTVIAQLLVGYFGFMALYLLYKAGMKK